MKKIILAFFVIFMIFSQSCRIRKNTVKTWDAAEFNYNLSKKDSIYIKAFREQDSLFIEQNIGIKYQMFVDSLIVYEPQITKKFYKDTFEVYEYLSDIDYNLYHYYYSGEIIRMYNYHGNNLNFERVNVDGTLHLRNISIGNSF